MGFDSSALNGTLVDFRPRTLLHFLGLTRKTGVLRVEAGEHAVAVSLRDGLVVGDAVETVVALLRVPQGRFSFDEVPVDGDGRPVDAVLAEATELVMDWEDVAQVVPSTAVVVSLCDEGDGEVRLTADGWAVSVAVAAGHNTPALLVEHLGWPALRVARAVVDLVANGRASVAPPARVQRSHSLAGRAETVLTSRAEQPLWPGQGETEHQWRTPWYDPSA